MNTLLGLDPNFPDQLLYILWVAQYRDSFPAETYRRLWQRDLDAISLRAPVFLGSDSHEDKVTYAVSSMIADIAMGKGDQGDDSYSIPRAWLRVFYDLHNAGYINSVVYGRAARFIYTSSDAGLGSSEHNAFCLEALRKADPLGLMYPYEHEFLSNEPDVITLYRGSFVIDPTHGAQGLSWTNNPHVAEGYSHMRSAIGQRSTHRTVLLEAEVPKAAILAVSLGPTPTYEALVDYEALPVLAVREATLAGMSIAMPAFADA
ncbi:hypothetical protein [Sphingomonas sp. RS2018]